MPVDPVVSAVRRADQAFYEQISQTEPLDFGIAFTSGTFPHSADANQLREIVLGDVPPADVYESTERYYAQRNLTCLRWVPALGQPTEPFDALLGPRGWARRDHLAMHLADFPNATVDKSIRILPARAMPRAYRATFDDPGDPRSAESRSALADESVERLNDSNYDVFVAMLDDLPVGRIGYHEVGDIAAVRDAFVLRSRRNRGVGRALMLHVLTMARRLGPRLLVLSLPTDDPGRGFAERFGFRAAGTLAEWRRGVA